MVNWDTVDMISSLKGIKQVKGKYMLWAFTVNCHVSNFVHGE